MSVRTVDEQYAYALSLINEGRTDTALLMLQNVLISNANHADARNDLGVLYFGRGELEQALNNLEVAYRLKARDEAVVSNLIEVYRALGRHSEAEACIRRFQEEQR